MQTARAKTDNNGTAEFLTLDRDGLEFVVEGSRAPLSRAVECAACDTLESRAACGADD